MSPIARRVLAFIASHRGATFSAISAHIGSNTPSLGGYHVRALTRAGLVERSVVGLRITEADERALAENA